MQTAALIIRVAVFLVRQACISAIGCKSRIRFTVGSISLGSKEAHREVESEGSRSGAFEPTNRKLHRRRGGVG
jgi:hypothetical protein